MTTTGGASAAGGETMATTGQVAASTGGVAERWYALSPDDVAERLGVDPAGGLTAAKAAELLQTDGPNALPAEKTDCRGGGASSTSTAPTCRSSCSSPASLSLAIGEWSTGAVLLLLTVFNAVVGLRQEGKAESAMNALKSLTKQTARVRRDGVEAAIPAEEVVIGDVVLLSAGDNVAADGRIIQANSLDIDESALTGESTPASKDDGRARRRRGRARRPDEHGVHEHAGHARQRHDDRDGEGCRRRGRQDRRHAGDDRQGTDAADEAAEHDDAVDRRGRAGDDDRHVRLGLSRGQTADTLFITAIALGHRGDPDGAADRAPGDPLARAPRSWPARTPSSRTSCRWRRSDRRRRSTPTRPAR